jgi:hypothetical protein
MHAKFLLESLKERDNFETGWECVDWVNMAQDGDCWRNVVNTVMNLRVP